MAKRKAITKRIRFEIFKRDMFTCQYCGKRPPNVILHVDHIVPVSSGGGNGDENLITSCSDCNLGKSDILLASVLPSRTEIIEREREAQEQLKAYSALLDSRRKMYASELSKISRVFIQLMGSDPKKYSVAGEMKRSIELFQKKLTTPEIIDAIEIAAMRFHPRDERFHKYFCGVCWCEIRSGNALS